MRWVNCEYWWYCELKSMCGYKPSTIAYIMHTYIYKKTIVLAIDVVAVVIIVVVAVGTHIFHRHIFSFGVAFFLLHRLLCIRFSCFQSSVRVLILLFSTEEKKKIIHFSFISRCVPSFFFLLCSFFLYISSVLCFT